MTSRDPYLDPDSGILRNRLGIANVEDLAAAEADFTAVRLAQLTLAPLEGEYDLAHLQRFHARIFGDVYGWAGQLRTIGIAKGVPFCPPEHLETYADEVFGRLADDGMLRGRDREAFLDGLTELIADLNALHPFREGNGRTLRAFTRQLAADAGHELRWAGMDPVENVAASRASLAGDNTALRTMLDRLVDRPDPRSIAPLPRRPRD